MHDGHCDCVESLDHALSIVYNPLWVANLGIFIVLCRFVQLPLCKLARCNPHQLARMPMVPLFHRQTLHFTRGQPTPRNQMINP